MSGMRTQSPGEEPRQQHTASRARVLAILRADPDDVSTQELSERTGLHGNTVRFHLERLEDEGLVTRQVRRSVGPGRPPLAYTAVPESDSERDRRSYAHLATALAALLSNGTDDPATAATDAGRAWGARRAGGPVRVSDVATGDGHAAPRTERAAPVNDAEALAELTAVLNEIGFAAAVREAESGQIVLQRRCPFLEVAQQHQAIVCSFHLGLMRGFLEARRARLGVATLIPFASPAGCQAHLAPAWSA